MRVCNLASGSKGNATYIETEKAKILIDCGLSALQMEKRLNEIGVDASEINAIFITHEHSDHIGGLQQFVKKNDAEVFIHLFNVDAVLSKQSVDCMRVSCFQQNKDFVYRDMIVSPFELSHDSVYCVGYSFTSGNVKVSIATDTGYMPKEALKTMLYSDLIYIESNHSELMLLNNDNYSAFLKKRILSSVGHLSNIDCAEAIYILSKGGTKNFVLSHLSENNNTPQVALKEVSERLSVLGVEEGKDVFIDIANQNSVGKIYEINKEISFDCDEPEIGLNY